MSGSPEPHILWKWWDNHMENALKRSTDKVCSLRKSEKRKWLITVPPLLASPTPLFHTLVIPPRLLSLCNDTNIYISIISFFSGGSCNYIENKLVCVSIPTCLEALHINQLLTSTRELVLFFLFRSFPPCLLPSFPVIISG
jgi:hypothetical protein